MKRRISMVTSAAAALALTLSFAAAAQSFPDKPIRLVVPYSPGGIADTMARLLGTSLHQSLKQPVIVENKPGANTAIAAMAVAKSPADGYTLLLATGGTIVMNPLLYQKLGYDPEKDFTTVAQMSLTPLLISVKADSQIGSIADLVRLAKAEPGKLSYASQGLGSTTQMAMELFQSAANISLNHVPYKGSGDSLNAAVGGTVDMSVDAVASAMPLIKGNRLRGIAVSTNVRSPYLPQVPTLAATAAPGYNVWVWYGIMAPAGTPPKVIERLNQAIVQAIAGKSFSEPLEKIGLVMAQPMTASAFNEFIQRERAVWGPLIKVKNIRLE